MNDPLELHRRIDQICNLFEEQWRSDRLPEISSWLERVEAPDRSQLLPALLEVDVELRVKAGQQVTPQDYQALGAEAMAIVDQLQCEGTSDQGRANQTTRQHPNSTGEVASQQIGPYKLLQQIGEGGMGTVWMAEQEKPIRRRVALKLIKAGVDNKQVVARFDAERQALAMMDHQNIARVIDAGSTDDGRPYFVMELVQGIPFNKYCDQNKLSINERLELFIPVCQAVQHAHQKGIIHRDLKPSNVLVSLYDGKPVPKVIDFGLAKALQHQSRLTDKTMFTEFGQVVGTLQYMSPEQAELNQLDIDTRTDIYSLGVMLYELLTGSTPIETETLKKNAILQILATIREHDPPRPSERLSGSTNEAVSGISTQRHIDPGKLKNILRGELDWIVMKALEKDRTRRYETANGLGVEIQRYLSGDPVQARPPSRVYLLRKYMRKNKGLVASLGAIAATLVIGAVGFAWQAKIASDERDDAIQAREDEKTQRQRADDQRDIAIKAQKEETARADELKLVSDFQAEMLEQVDPTEAGIRLTRDVNDRFVAALAKTNVPEAEHKPRADAFRQEWLLVNATDTALALIDETILKPAVKAVDEQFQDQPVVDARLRQVLAERYRDIGLYDAAFPLQEHTLETRRRVLGDEHADTLRSISNMGLLLKDNGKLPEAEPYLREALEKRGHVLGEDHLDTIISISNMGTLSHAQGKLSEAELYWREALEKSRSVLGDEHTSTLVIINNMGTLFHERGKLAEAEPYIREALDKSRRVFGEDHPETLTNINNMGLLLQAQGKLSEAEPFYREALDKSRRVLGEEHPDTLISISNMGFLVIDQGKMSEAEPFYREALEKSRRVLGEEHPSTLRFVSNMGWLFQAQGKLAEAEPYIREALEKRRRLLGEEHPDMLASVAIMGSLLNAQGKLAEAEPFYREALEKFPRVLGEEHPDTLMSINNLGFLLQAQGKHAEAEPYYREALEKRRRLLGEDHTDTAGSIASIGSVLQAQGKLAEAEPFYRETLEKWRRLLGDEHPSSLTAIGDLGNLLIAQGKHAEAEPLCREALEKKRRVLGEEHPETLVSINNLAALLKAQGRLGEAEPYYREALEMSRRVLGQEHPSTLVYISNLGFLLFEQGRLAEAEPYCQEAIEKSRSLLGDEHPNTLIFINNMGALLHAQRKHRDAIELLSPIEPLARKAFTGANARRVALLLTTLGRARVGLGYDAEQFKLAESNLLEAHPIYVQTRGESHKDTFECVQGLVELYTAWHAAELDKGYDAKAAEWKEKLLNESSADIQDK